MKYNTRAALAALIFLPALTLGCAKKTVVGKWSGTQNGMNVTMEFKDGGAFTQDTTTPMGPIQAVGTWKVAGESITLATTDVTMKGASVMAMIPANMKAMLNQNATFKFEKDDLILTNKGQSLTLTPLK